MDISVLLSMCRWLAYGICMFWDWWFGFTQGCRIYCISSESLWNWKHGWRLQYSNGYNYLLFSLKGSFVIPRLLEMFKITENVWTCEITSECCACHTFRHITVHLFIVGYTQILIHILIPALYLAIYYSHLSLKVTRLMGDKKLRLCRISKSGVRNYR